MEPVRETKCSLCGRTGVSIAAKDLCHICYRIDRIDFKLKNKQELQPSEVGVLKGLFSATGGVDTIGATALRKLNGERLFTLAFKAISSKEAGMVHQTATCTSKANYATEILAKEAAKRQMDKTAGLELFTYECPFGDHWHLTKKNQSEATVAPTVEAKSSHYKYGDLYLAKVIDPYYNFHVFVVPPDCPNSAEAIMKQGAYVAFKNKGEPWRDKGGITKDFKALHALSAFQFNGEQAAWVANFDRHRNNLVDLAPPTFSNKVAFSALAVQPAVSKAEMFKGRPVLRDKAGPYITSAVPCQTCKKEIAMRRTVSVGEDGKFTRMQTNRPVTDMAAQAMPDVKGGWLCGACATPAKKAETRTLVREIPVEEFVAVTEKVAKTIEEKALPLSQQLLGRIERAVAHERSLLDILNNREKYDDAFCRGAAVMYFIMKGVK